MSIQQPLLVNSVLSFIKAFRLKGDKRSLISVVADRFSSSAVDNAKKDLWNFCSDKLIAANLPFQARRDSVKRRQLIANLEDIIEAFDTLHISDSIPSIYYEAIDLLNLPPLSLHATAEQVQKNSEVLQNLVSQIGSLEKKLTSLGPAGLASSSSCSYAMAASANPASPAIRPSSSLTRSYPASTSPHPDSRACNVILFGLPEASSILKLKSEVDDLLTFITGKSLNIHDVFRLGKFSASSSTRPRPLLSKLPTAWDRRVVLLQRRKLKDYKIPWLFLREDVPPNHQLRQKVVPKDKASVVASSKKTSSPQHSSASLHTAMNFNSQTVRCDPTVSSVIPSNVRSPSPTPSQCSASSFLSSTTVLQGHESSQNGPT